MRIVRDRADARWLPSRFRFALFRIAALVVMSRLTPREKRGLVLIIDRDQSAVEQHLLSLGAVLAGTLFMAGALQPTLGVTAALILSLPLTLGVFSTVLVAAGLVIEPLVAKAGASLLVARKLNGLTHMALLTAAAIFFATRQSWVRPFAWTFLIVVGCNLIAAVAMLALGSREAALNQRFGVPD
jgi:hypothetical protein